MLKNHKELAALHGRNTFLDYLFLLKTNLYYYVLEKLPQKVFFCFVEIIFVRYLTFFHFLLDNETLLHYIWMIIYFLTLNSKNNEPKAKCLSRF